MTKARSNAVAAAAKGDLTVGTGTNLSGILPVSATNGDTIVADSSQASGLSYIPATVASNPVLNSAYQIWQRGTSISTASAGYTADRWYAQAATNGTVSRQVTNDTTNLPNIQFAARVQRTAAATTVTDYQIGQSFESVNSIPFAGKAVTFSFFARKGANYSAASSILNVALATGTGTDQNLITGYTGQAVPINSTATLTTSWQRFTYTGTIATTATEMAINYYYTSVGTAGAADYFEITGVQIDVGSVALPFRTNGATIQGETSACQRYYYRQTAADSGGFSPFAFGSAESSTITNVKVIVPVTLRALPTSVDFSTLQLADGVNAGQTITALVIDVNSSSRSIVSLAATVASGLTQFRTYFARAANSTGAFLGFSAEL